MAEQWQIEILSPAERDLRAIKTISRELGNNAYDEILEDILDLRDNPLPPGHLLLRGTKSDYRIYSYRSLYRIVYRLLPARRKVLIGRVKPRGSVYSGLDRW